MLAVRLLRTWSIRFIKTTINFEVSNRAFKVAIDKANLELFYVV